MDTNSEQSFTHAEHLKHLQEEEYAFPYHYVSRFRGGFSTHFYDNWAINYISTIEYLLTRLKEEDFQRLADIGCGDGRFTCELAQSFPQTEIIGIDYSKRAIALARALCPNVTYVASNIIEVDLKASFDGATLMEVFEHIPPVQSDKFVASIAELLIPGGFLYVTVPHINKALEYKHFRHFSSASLIKSFKSHFDCVEIVPFELRSWRRRVLESCLGNRFFILHHRRILNWLYRYHKRYLFSADESSCQRLFAKLKKR